MKNMKAENALLSLRLAVFLAPTAVGSQGDIQHTACPRTHTRRSTVLNKGEELEARLWHRRGYLAFEGCCGLWYFRNRKT